MSESYQNSVVMLNLFKTGSRVVHGGKFVVIHWYDVKFLFLPSIDDVVI
jgi:hypothetical protein